MNSEFDLLRACDKAISVLIFRRLDHDVYALESAGEVSLVTQATLVDILRQKLGGTNEVGGGSVGRA